MVRFSDLLGGNGDQEDPRPITAPAPRVAEQDPDPESKPEAEIETIEDARAALAVAEPSPGPVESPQEVLDRLTQYATSARAGDAAAEVPEPVSEAPAQPLASDPATGESSPVGDDLLPRSGSARKAGRGRKRRAE
jgi:hypothetical protein